MDTPTFLVWCAAQMGAVSAAAWAHGARTLRTGRVRPVALSVALAATPLGAIGAEYIVHLGAHVASHGRGLPPVHGSMAYGALAAYALVQAALAPRGQRWGALGDAVGPLACLVAVGRLGCAAGGCEPGIVLVGMVRHPVALYEVVVALGAWALAWRAESALRSPRARFVAFTVAYAAGRAAIETLRDPGPLTGAGPTIAQWVSLGVACATLLAASSGRASVGAGVGGRGVGARVEGRRVGAGVGDRGG